MGDNFVFLVLFDTCDVVYNWSISLLPLVLDNLFEFDMILHPRCEKYRSDVVLNQLEEEVNSLLWEKEAREKESHQVRQNLEGFEGYGYVSRPDFQFKETREREDLGEYIITRN